MRRETFPVERICSLLLKWVRWGLKPNIAPEEDVGGNLELDPEAGERARMCSNNAIPPPIAPTVPSAANPATAVRRDIPGPGCIGSAGNVTGLAGKSSRAPLTPSSRLSPIHNFTHCPQ